MVKDLSPPPNIYKFSFLVLSQFNYGGGAEGARVNLHGHGPVF